MKAYAFISYQTADKLVAGEIKDILESVGITSFLAHEDIGVSEEWRIKILDEIGAADLFVSVLSNNYYSSPWCIQESGIAAYRNNLTIIPLSIDGSIPKGLFANIQSTKIEPGKISITDLLPGLIKFDFNQAVDEIIEMIGESGSFRGAEANFEMILPHLDGLTPDQNKRLLEHAARNNQIHHAGLCATEYLPPLIDKHGHLLDSETKEFLQGICDQYLTQKREWEDSQNR